MFVGPPDLDAEWDDRGIDGVNRLLRRFWTLAADSADAGVEATRDMIRIRNQLVHDVTGRLESFSLNTVVSAFMEYNNKLIDIARKSGGVDAETICTFAQLLAPFAPHIAEEIWERYGHTDSVFHSEWPSYSEEAMQEDTVELPVSVNGKTRAVITVPRDVSKEDAVSAAKEAVASRLTGEIIKEIYVPGRMVNIVVKG